LVFRPLSRFELQLGTFIFARAGVDSVHARAFIECAR
jgi:hypothetical protein